MKTAESIILQSISDYNSQVNDLSKFKLNERESKMFTDCMKLYANQKLDEAYFSCNLIHSFDDESKPEFIETYNTPLGVVAPNLQSILSLKDKL